MHHCLRCSSMANRESEFMVGAPSLYENRWNEIYDFCIAVRDRLLVMRPSWSEARWRAAVVNSKDDGTFQPRMITELLRNNYFFAYMDTIIAIGSVPQSLGSWAEGCCCHEDLLIGERQDRRRKKLRRAFNEKATDCPMRGKRLPELSVGALQPYFDEICGTAISHLLLDHHPYLQDHLWTKVVNMFELGKAALWAGLKVKLDFAERLPWKFASLTHHDAAQAVSHAKDILQDFDTQDRPTQLLHHPIVLEILGDGCPTRAEFIAFARGEITLSGTHHLASKILPFKFVPIVERYIEGVHSLVKRSVPHRHTPVLVSLAVRLPRLEDTLFKKPEILPDLLRCFDQCRDTLRLPATLGLASHPKLLEMSKQSRVRRDQVVKLLSLIIYRADTIGQFQETKEDQKHHEAHKRRADARAKKVVPGALPLPACYDSVLQSALTSHFQAVATLPDHKLTIYSLPSSDEVLATSFARSLSARHTQQAAARLALECDVDIGIGGNGLQSDTLQERIYFSVVKGAPSNWHTVPVSRAAATKLAHGAVAIALHRTMASSDVDNPIVCRRPQMTQAPVSILQGLRERPADVVRATLMKWESSPTFMYDIEDFVVPDLDQKIVQHVITSLVRARALPQSNCGYTTTSREEQYVLQHLCMNGFATKEDQEGSEGADVFFLTKKALASLGYGTAMVNPTCALEPRANLAIKDMTNFELIVALGCAGFEWDLLPDGIESRRALCHAQGGERHWYSAGPQVCSEYLQCLLQAEEIFQAGIHDAIPHFAAKHDYSKILRGEKLTARLALECDVEIDHSPRRRPRRRSALAPLSDEGSRRGCGRGRDRGSAHPEPAVPAAPLENLGEGDCPGGPEPEGGADDGSTSGRAPDSGDDAGFEDEGMFAMVSVGDLEKALEEIVDADAGPRPDDEHHDRPPASPPLPPPRSSPALVLAAAPAEDFRMRPKFRWGVFRFTSKLPNAAVRSTQLGWQCACPFHKRNENTECTKFQPMLQMTAACEEEAIWCLKQWAVAAGMYHKSARHQSHPCHREMLPAQEVVESVIEASRIDVLPDGWVVTSDRHQAMEAHEAATRARGSGGRGRGRGQAGQRGGGRARGRGKGDAVPEPQGKGGRQGKARGRGRAARSGGAAAASSTDTHLAAGEDGGAGAPAPSGAAMEVDDAPAPVGTCSSSSNSSSSSSSRSSS